MIERDLNPINLSALDQRIRIALVAPHPVQRTRVIHTVQVHQDLDIVGVMTNEQEVIRLCPHIRPDVVVVDPWEADMDGQALAGLIQSRWPWVQVLVIGSGTDPHEMALGEATNSSRLLPEGIRDRNLGATIRTLFARRNGTPSWNTSGPPLRVFRDQALSQRDWEVWQALKMDLSDLQIAEQLGVNELTARIHVQNVLDHLGVSSRKEVATNPGDRAQSPKARSRLSPPKPREPAVQAIPALYNAVPRHFMDMQSAGGRYP